ncbi:MAG: NAD(+)/NADH kinase [Balneolaceae bacterium]
MKFSIIAHPDKYKVHSSLRTVLEWCKSHGAKAYATENICKSFDGFSNDILVPVGSEKDAVSYSDVVIAIGGDGTLLYTAQLTKESDIHVLGINSGRLGFMANIQVEQIVTALNAIRNKEYRIDERAMLQAEINGNQTFHALNELLFTKKDTTSLITLTASYDDVFINRYWADGLIVATPTGSTAYNLSTGGPIVMPGTPVMVLTPINPHTLTTRPLVLPSDKTLTVEVEEDPGHMLFSNDGKITNVESDRVIVKVKKSDYTVKLIQLEGQNYFDTLRNKLMWGLDNRKKS